MCSLDRNTMAASLDLSSTPELPLPGFLSSTERRSRRKLWDIPVRLHCPIIGTCLDVNELRKIGSKDDRAGFRAASEYEVHVNFVCAAEYKNPLSLATYKALEKKYKQTVKTFSSAKNESTLLEKWREHIEIGKVADALWALASHPKVTDKLYKMAYEEIHMLSHQVGAGYTVDRIKLVELQQKVKSVQEQHAETLRQTSQRLSEKEQKILNLTEEAEKNGEAQQQLRKLKQQVERYESGQELHQLRDHIMELEPKLNKAQVRYENARQQMLELKQRYLIQM